MVICGNNCLRGESQSALSFRLKLHGRLHSWHRGAAIVGALVHALFLFLIFLPSRNDVIFQDVVAPMALVGCFVLVIAAPAIYERNAHRLTEIDDVRVIGPLLDLVAPCVQNRVFEPVSPRTRTEMRVVERLPRLLNRISAGDGPALSQEQRAALRLLASQREFRSEFGDAGLRRKVEAASRR